MSLLSRLGSLALRPCLSGVAHLAAEAAGCSLAKVALDTVEKYLVSRFTDPSRELPNALSGSADRAWLCLEVALGGESILGWLTRRGEDKAFTKQVRAFLDANPLQLPPGHDAAFRRRALEQLRAARKSKLIPGAVEPESLARQAAEFTRFSDPAALHDAEWQALAAVADQLRQAGHDALAEIIALRAGPEQPSLLAVAVRFCFRSEVVANPRLFQGLVYEQVDALRHDLAAGFDGLATTLGQHRQLIEAALADLLTIAEETRDHVLDLKAEMARRGEALQAIYATLIRQGEKLDRLHERPLRPGDSLSIRAEGERQLVREVVARYRALPEEQRRQLPALLAAVGRLEFAAGDFGEAQRDFQQQAEWAGDPAARAAAHHGAYLAALERRHWGTALTELHEAARLDPERFAPFPLDRYEPERLLGAGGFGVVFLCRNRLSKARLVVKALRTDELERDLATVLEEAATLEELDHPAIIRLRDCGFADAAGTRPYLVMDYFDGPTLEEQVRQHGPLPAAEARAVAVQIAAGLQAAHARNILHRDVKPGNVLIRPAADDPSPGSRWQVKLIDFGLALRRQAVHTTMSNADVLAKTTRGQSVAGTIDYAAPEQLGKLAGVAVGPHSDVYGFGKTVCFAVFGTAQPGPRHWRALGDDELAELLGQCIEERPENRPTSLAEVMGRLQAERGREERAEPEARAPAAPEPAEAESKRSARDDYADVQRDFEEYWATMLREGATEAHLQRFAPGRLARWRSAAEAGIAEAQVLLGDCCEVGAGVAKDGTEAARWYRKAAEAGNVPAMTNLGNLYSAGEVVPEDHAEALRWYHRAAKAGEAFAMVALGGHYRRGEGVAQDQARALHWYRKAAEAGNALAMLNLGNLSFKGELVPQDFAEAFRSYHKAAEAGNAMSMGIVGNCYRVGRGVPQDDAEAWRWYRKAVDAGLRNEAILYVMGKMCEEGRGVRQDDAEALRWYRMAAEAGDSDAMKKAGEWLKEGRGGGRDDAEALRWYRQAAEAGDGDAMYEVGKMYHEGLGGRADGREALRWYQKAVDTNNSTPAKMGIFRLYLTGGEGVEPNAEEGMRWYRKIKDDVAAKGADAVQRLRELADAGNAEAMFQLGIIYVNGTSVKKDRREAARWLGRAAQQGHEEARKELKKLQSLSRRKAAGRSGIVVLCIALGGLVGAGIGIVAAPYGAHISGLLVGGLAGLLASPLIGGVVLGLAAYGREERGGEKYTAGDRKGGLGCGAVMGVIGGTIAGWIYGPDYLSWSSSPLVCGSIGAALFGLLGGLGSWYVTRKSSE